LVELGFVQRKLSATVTQHLTGTFSIATQKCILPLAFFSAQTDEMTLA